MIKVLGSLILLLACALVSSAADCRQRVVVQQQHYQYQQYAEPIYAAAYAPLAVYIPTYSISYTPTQPAPAPAAQADPTLKQLLDEVQKIRGEVEQIKKGGQTPPLEPLPPPAALKGDPAPAPESHLRIFQAKCALCHAKDNAQAKGRGLILIDGQKLAPLTDAQKLAVIRELYSGRMPKGGKATDEEVALVIEGLR